VWKTILKIRLARHENRSTHDSLVEQRCELERQLEGRPKDIPVWNSWDRGTHPDQWISKDVYKLFVDAVPFSHADRDSVEQYVRGRIANFLSAKQDG
jgi:hypothetical protein